VEEIYSQAPNDQEFALWVGQGLTPSSIMEPTLLCPTQPGPVRCSAPVVEAMPMRIYCSGSQFPGGAYWYMYGLE
jgi:hypothetical protein